MIARLFVLLPFHINLPEGEEFKIYDHALDGYTVNFFPPMQSERVKPVNDFEETVVKINGVATIKADILRIDFRKENFDRSPGTKCDPPELIINQAINSFLIRMRHVCKAAQIRTLNFPSCTWRIQYLNDDETELEKNPPLIRGRGTSEIRFSCIALNSKIWEDIQGLPLYYQPMPWESLLLDAEIELPNIGPAIVLASTALEVFIAHILDKLAATKVTPPELWTWINKRNDWLREPTLEEQYDTLSKYLVGHSLKDYPKLWESFKNLKSARNSFVHEGIAKIGDVPVTTEKAQKLIVSASEVIATAKQWLPKELHWPEFKHDTKIEMMKRIF